MREIGSQLVQFLFEFSLALLDGRTASESCQPRMNSYMKKLYSRIKLRIKRVKLSYGEMMGKREEGGALGVVVINHDDSESEFCSFASWFTTWPAIIIPMVAVIKQALPKR